MEPQIRNLVDKEVKNIELANAKRIDYFIDALASKDVVKVREALSFLQTKLDYVYSDEQRVKIINSYRQKQNEGSRLLFLAVLMYDKSPIVVEFHKTLVEESIKGDGSDTDIMWAVLTYLIGTAKDHDIALYEDAIKRHALGLWIYTTAIDIASLNNQILSIKLLNSQKCVDALYSSSDKSTFESTQKYTSTLLNRTMKTSDYIHTYFFTKK